jgi:hypothetical protein
LNGQTFSIDSQDLGYGDQQKVVLSFSGEKLDIRRTDRNGWGVSVDGEQARVCLTFRADWTAGARCR